MRYSGLFGKTLKTVPAEAEAINHKLLLKAGFIDRGIYNPTETGTPQGGVISPLLANIGLHGLEE